MGEAWWQAPQANQLQGLSSIQNKILRSLTRGSNVRRFRNCFIATAVRLKAGQGLRLRKDNKSCAQIVAPHLIHLKPYTAQEEHKQADPTLLKRSTGSHSPMP